MLDVLRASDLTGGKGSLEDMGLIDYETTYPYNGQCSTKCRYQGQTVPEGKLYVKPEAWSRSGGGDSEKIYEDHLKKGPFVIGINACEDFRDYEEGILDTNKCTGELNHSLLLVGYGTVTTYTGYKNKDHGVKQDYWIARNSWGIGWGEDGYVRIARNKNVGRIGAAYLAINRMDGFDRTLIKDDGTPIDNSYD